MGIKQKLQDFKLIFKVINWYKANKDVLEVIKDKLRFIRLEVNELISTVNNIKASLKESEDINK